LVFASSGEREEGGKDRKITPNSHRIMYNSLLTCLFIFLFAVLGFVLKVYT
jgi:hypothetical protein